MEPTSQPPAVSRRSVARARRRFPLFELLLVTVSASASTFALTRDHYVRAGREAAFFARPAQREFATLIATSDSTRHARTMEEMIIRDYFNDRRGGAFLEVGANDDGRKNTTHFLESELGWSGVAIGIPPELAPDYASHPSRTTLVTMATQVPINTLTLALHRAGVSRIDLLFMTKVTLSDSKALAGLDIDRFQPSLVCIDANQDVRQQILDYFASHHYVVIGKYLRIDPNNLYFMPAAKGN